MTGISTLCHDIHVETHLREEGIALADGFSEKEEEDVRYWDGDFSSNSKTPFLKLHGSVDWFRFRPDDSSSYWYDDRIGIGDPYHTRRDDRPQTALDGGRPLLLIGTFNKVADYSQGIFLDSPPSISFHTSRSRSIGRLRIQLRRQGDQRGGNRVVLREARPTPPDHSPGPR